MHHLNNNLHRLLPIFAAVLLACGLASVPTAHALAGDCDGTTSDDNVTCAANPTNPDNFVGLDLGNDTFTLNDGVTTGSVAGDGGEAGFQSFANHEPGNDILTINGTVNGDVYGDYTAGSGGVDTITLNGTVNGNVLGDGVLGHGGNDTITINGAVSGDVQGDGANSYTNGGDDTIIINSTVGGSVYGDGIMALEIGFAAQTALSGVISSGICGDDLITINDAVKGDVLADTCTNGGDDTVTVGDGASVGGVIDGGPGTDTLQFTFLSPADLAGYLPAGGSFTYNDQTYTWLNFEGLLGLLDDVIEEPVEQPQAGGGTGSTGPQVIFRSSDALGLMAVNAMGVDVYAAPGHIAFIPFADLASLQVGDGGLQYQLPNGGGWFVKVFLLGPYDVYPNLNWYQVNVYDSNGTLVSDLQGFAH